MQDDGEAYRLGAGDEEFRDFSSLQLKPDHFNRWVLSSEAVAARAVGRAGKGPWRVAAGWLGRGSEAAGCLARRCSRHEGEVECSARAACCLSLQTLADTCCFACTERTAPSASFLAGRCGSAPTPASSWRPSAPCTSRWVLHLILQCRGSVPAWLGWQEPGAALDLSGSSLPCVFSRPNCRPATFHRHRRASDVHFFIAFLLYPITSSHRRPTTSSSPSLSPCRAQSERLLPPAHPLCTAC